MAAVVTFVHLSDLHVGDPAVADPTLLTDTGATLAVVVEVLKGLSPTPSFVAVSGDLTNRGDPPSYRIVGEALAALDCPVVYALGNHDTRRGYAEGLSIGPADGDAPAVADHMIDGVHILVLDTGVPGRIGGALDDAQFRWLDATLRRHPGATKILVMHHPPALDGDSGWKTLAAADTDRLAGLLRGRGVAAVLCGHIHQDRVAIWEGIPVVTVSGQHATVDALHTDGLRAVRGASFGLCRLGPSGFAVTFVQLPSDRAEVERIPNDTVMGFV